MSEPEMGPLSQMMLDNTDLVGTAIDAYGPSAVAEFFINVGTSIAALYEIPEADRDVELERLEEHPE